MEITKEILEYYYIHKQFTPKELSKVFRFGITTIRNYLKKYNIPIRNIKAATSTEKYLNMKARVIDGNELYQDYVVKQMTIKDMVIKYKTNHFIVRRNLNENGIEVVDRNKININKEFLEEYYINKQYSRNDIAEIVGCSGVTISKYLKLYDIPVRVNKQAHNTNKYLDKFQKNIEADNLYQDYIVNGLSINDICEKYQMPYGTVRSNLLRSNIQIRDRISSNNMPLKKDKLSIAGKKLFTNPIDKENQLKRMRKGLQVKPNKPETAVLGILDKYYPKEWRFVGDGQVWIAGLNPDFINVNGKKIIIEVFGNYWHSEKRNKQRIYRINEDRAELFAEYGYKTLIIWENETKDIEKLTETINQFMENY